jgi:putative molybdenum carrier protein
VELAMKIVSGGQTGIDRAALDAAMSLGMEVGGWCPRGRWAEDGRIPDRYPLCETRSQDVHVRTQRNVECSSATLVITRGSPMGGTRYTVEVAESIRRPVLLIDLLQPRSDVVGEIVAWLERIRPPVLNVAGPRESGAPGITDEARELLSAAFQRSAWARERPDPFMQASLRPEARA